MRWLGNGLGWLTGSRSWRMAEPGYTAEPIAIVVWCASATDDGHRARQFNRRIFYAWLCACFQRKIECMSKRVSLILKDADEAVIAPYLDKDSDAFDMLKQWAEQRGQVGIKTEAAALRALLQAGIETVRNQALDNGYAQLAEEFNAEPAHIERRAARDRYTERTEGRL